MFNSSIVLIGMPGSGKTALGQILAQLLDLPFHDSDVQIAKTLGLSLPEILAQKGEAFFRHNEALACRTLLAHSEGIIALGSGAVLSPDLAPLLAHHTVIYLKASLSSLCERLRLQGKVQDNLESLEAELTPRYQRLAKYTLTTDRRAPMSLVREVMELTGVAEEVC